MSENARQFDRIYLTDADYYEEGDGPVLWCYDRIADDDVEYVNIAAFEAQAERIAKLEAMLTQLEWAGGSEWIGLCPECGAGDYDGHNAGCTLYALLHK